jgi:hypothetical protein
MIPHCCIIEAKQALQIQQKEAHIMARKIQVKLILLLRSTGMSQRAICQSHHMSRSSVGEVFRIAEEKQLTYTDVETLSNAEGFNKRNSGIFSLNTTPNPSRTKFEEGFTFLFFSKSDRENFQKAIGNRKEASSFMI